MDSAVIHPCTFSVLLLFLLSYSLLLSISSRHWDMMVSCLCCSSTMRSNTVLSCVSSSCVQEGRGNKDKSSVIHVHICTYPHVCTYIQHAHTSYTTIHTYCTYMYIQHAHTTILYIYIQHAHIRTYMYIQHAHTTIHTHTIPTCYLSLSAMGPTALTWELRSRRHRVVMSERNWECASMIWSKSEAAETSFCRIAHPHSNTLQREGKGGGRKKAHRVDGFGREEHMKSR